MTLRAGAAAIRNARTAHENGAGTTFASLVMASPSIWGLYAFLMFALTLTPFVAQASDECFTDKMTIDESYRVVYDGPIPAKEYLLGVDRLLSPVLVKFFADGRVCGVSTFPRFRFQGKNYAEGKVRLTFLRQPDEPAEQSEPEDRKEPLEQWEIEDKKAQKREKEILATLFTQELTGEAQKSVSKDLILWEGRLTNKEGRTFDFYLKRTRDGAPRPRAATKNYCGDVGCEPLTVTIEIKSGFEGALRNDIKQMPVTELEAGPYCVSMNEAKDGKAACFRATTWPFEEDHVVAALKRRHYVRSVWRPGIGAGTDTESFYLETDKLLSSNLKLNVPVVAPLFQSALEEYFKGTGLKIPEPASRQNSLFWTLKGKRFQFEKNDNPSPAEKSEWWNVRLQVGVTEMNGGTYVLLISLPRTRVFSWGLDSVPNDEKFTAEVDNDDRFLDLQGRLIVAITKMVPAMKNMP